MPLQKLVKLKFVDIQTYNEQKMLGKKRKRERREREKKKKKKKKKNKEEQGKSVVKVR
jgi:hypothetical protein